MMVTCSHEDAMGVETRATAVCIGKPIVALILAIALVSPALRSWPKGMELMAATRRQGTRHTRQVGKAAHTTRTPNMRIAAGAIARQQLDRTVVDFVHERRIARLTRAPPRSRRNNDRTV